MATPRELLASRLRQARLDAGHATHGALAKKLHVSRSVITKAESSAQPVPSEATLTSIAEATGADLEALTDLANRAKSGTPDWFVPYLSAESFATMLRCWAPLIIPGLLQTEAYARAIFSVEPYAPERLDELVAARMERQRVLERTSFIVAIDYGVLRRMIGSAQVMADQCAHLISMAERPNISLYVVPEHTNTGVWGGLDIASRDGAITVALATGRADVTTTAVDVVDDVMQAFERVLGSAMPCGESLNSLREMEDWWRTQA